MCRLDISTINGVTHNENLASLDCTITHKTFRLFRN